MDVSALTRGSLPVRLREVRDATTWEELVEIYAPLVYGLDRRRGFQDADVLARIQALIESVQNE